jgi:hypothetical protein
MKRRSMSRGTSRRDFTRKAGVHPMNFRGMPMRGGIRL